MGHVVLAAPGIEHFHLVERLVRELAARRHGVTLLCLEPVDHTFWTCQGLPAALVLRSRPMAMRAPLCELAAADCLLQRHRPTGRPLQAAVRRLGAWLPGVVRFFETARPDLLLLHQERTAAQRLLHFVAREHGVRTVWTGRGLLPHTMQIDEEGLDGDSRTARRSAWDFRRLDSDDAFLSAALAAVVGRTLPPSLARRMLRVPPLFARLRDAVRSLATGHRYGFLAAIDAWHRGAAPPAPTAPGEANLPGRPFVAVLLQRDDDERLLLDAAAPPDPAMLTRAVRAAVRRIDPQMPVVAVLPPGGLRSRELTALYPLHDLMLERAAAAIDACLCASAVVTVNCARAATALLAHTPVVHLGRAIYGVPGIATRARLDALPQALDQALGEQQPELQKRFLTWVLRHGHLWCSTEHPDHNGLSGLVAEIERRMAIRGPYGRRLHYRPGPAWPLASDEPR